MVGVDILLLGVHQALVVEQADLLLPRGDLFMVDKLYPHHCRVEKGHQTDIGGSEVTGSGFELYQDLLNAIVIDRTFSDP